MNIDVNRFKVGRINTHYEKAKEIADYFGIPIGAVLGQMSRKGERAIEMIYFELKRQPNNSPALFFWKCKQEKII